MKLKRIIACIVFVVSIFPYSSFAQNSSVYSSIGIGDVRYSFSSMSLGMGQTGASLALPDNIELINPATWYKLNRTRFNLGIMYKGLMLKDNSGNGYNDFAQINGFTFSFPVSNELGISAALGVVPYSNIDYKLVQNFNVSGSSDNYNITYTGKGGLSKAFFGASYKFPFDLGIGATFEYYFGDITYNSVASIVGLSGSSSQYSKTLSPSGVGTTIGVISPDLSKVVSINNISNVRLGLSVNYLNDLRTDSLITSNSTAGTDTLNGGTANLKIPMRISAGISFAVNNNYLLSLDVVSQPWQNFSYAGIKSNELRNSLRVGAGMEYRPKEMLGASFWEQIIWRAGLSLEQSQYKINNTGVNRVSISGGLSVPLSYANYIDLDFEYALQGTVNSNLVRENVFTFNLGINLGQLWFIRRAY